MVLEEEDNYVGTPSLTSKFQIMSQVTLFTYFLPFSP